MTAKSKGNDKKSKKKEKKIKCTGDCSRELVETQFYMSASPMFPNGRVNICKDCIKEMIDYNNMETIYMVLRTIDIPFVQDIWEACEERHIEKTKEGKKYDVIGNYIRQINSLTQYKSSGWKNSSFKRSEVSTEESNKEKTSLEDKRQLQEIWGNEWTTEELLLLDKTYKELSADKNMKYNSSKQYMKLATMNYVRSYVAMQKGNASDADKYTKLFNETMKMGEFNPSALSKNSNLEKLGSFSDFSLMVEECVDIIDIQKILPEYMQMPRDLPDKVIWYVVNYMQDSLGYKMSSYEDVYKFYSQMEQDYYGIPANEIPKSSTVNDILNM